MAKKRSKKRKKSIIIIYTLIIIIVCSIILFIYLPNNKNTLEDNSMNTNNNKEEEVISNILSYNIEENIDKKFLEWINENYSIEVLTTIEKSILENNYSSNIWHELTNQSLIVLLDKYNEIDNDRMKELANNNITTISFVGDVSLADNWYIAPKYDERNKKIYGILSENVVNIMNEADIMVANNEFTISNGGEKMPNKLYTFRASPERLSIYEEMGVDLVTLANNHIFDFGVEAFNDALNSLEQYDIPYIGAGRNIEEAQRPYYFIANGYKIGFINATRAEKNILTPEATETTGGVLRCYDPTNFMNVIKETKENSDFVIALVHWGKEDSSELEQVQIDTAKLYIDAGADIIVGSHAHTLQGFDFYKEKAIIYNLGDFIFNNETKDTGIFQLKMDNNGNFKYYFKPCKEKEEYTYLLEGDEMERVLDKMRNLSPNVIINKDGEFYQK